MFCGFLYGWIGCKVKFIKHYHHSVLPFAIEVTSMQIENPSGSCSCGGGWLSVRNVTKSVRLLTTARRLVNLLGPTLDIFCWMQFIAAKCAAVIVMVWSILVSIQWQLCLAMGHFSTCTGVDPHPSHCSMLYLFAVNLCTFSMMVAWIHHHKRRVALSNAKEIDSSPSRCQVWTYLLSFTLVLLCQAIPSPLSQKLMPEWRLAEVCLFDRVGVLSINAKLDYCLGTSWCKGVQQQRQICREHASKWWARWDDKCLG